MSPRALPLVLALALLALSLEPWAGPGGRVQWLPAEPVDAAPLLLATPVSCPSPSASASPSSASAGSLIFVSATGYQPGSTVSIQVTGPASTSSSAQADSSCRVQGFVDTTGDPPGSYTVTFSGQRPSPPGGTLVLSTSYQLTVASPTATRIPRPTVHATATEISSAQPPAPAPTPTSLPVPPPAPTPTSLPVPPPGAEQPPVALDQTITFVGGERVPQVGRATEYEHVARITNVSGRPVSGGPLDLLARLGEVLFGSAAQGQGLSVVLSTDYSADTRVVSATAPRGQVSVRGSSVIWEGQLAEGESVDLRTRLEHTPTTVLTLNQPIRGQSFSVVDQRGVSLVVPPPAVPLLPPEQRLVQPSPPPVDPTTGSRFFSETGFAVADDSIWVFYHRRGGERTFGAPISRRFVLFGTPMQLFERGLIQVEEEEGQVVAVNLLNPPYLPYESFGDLVLPAVDEALLLVAPDPADPAFATLAQEFVQANAPEEFEGMPTRFYTTFLSSVLFFDAFYDGQGDPNLIPGFNLEIWGLPTGPPGYAMLGPEEVSFESVLLPFQRGLMRYDGQESATQSVPLGYYLRDILLGEALPELAEAAALSPLWAQYNPEGADWINRPEELPDSNLALAFEPDEE